MGGEEQIITKDSFLFFLCSNKEYDLPVLSGTHLVLKAAIEQQSVWIKLFSRTSHCSLNLSARTSRDDGGITYTSPALSGQVHPKHALLGTSRASVPASPEFLDPSE